jgi:putative transcriptional regulator
MPDHQRQVHNRLAVLRAERGLSRKQLPEKLGINYQTIGYIEKRRLQPQPRTGPDHRRAGPAPRRGDLQPQADDPLSEEIFGEPPAETR